MGWQIDLFRVKPGQDPRKVRDVQYDWEQHEGYSVSDASAETDEWIFRAIALIETVEPEWKVDDDGDSPSMTFDRRGHIEHVRVWQPDGPIYANLYPDCGDVRVQRGVGESRGGEHFSALWRVCKALADRAECAVFPEYDDDPTDMSLSEAEARAAYNWA